MDIRYPTSATLKTVPIIEIFVKLGDNVNVDDPRSRLNPTKRRWTCLRRRLERSRRSPSRPATKSAKARSFSSWKVQARPPCRRRQW